MIFILSKVKLLLKLKEMNSKIILDKKLTEKECMPLLYF